MGKHGKNTTGRAEKLKAKARAKRKLLKKAQARVPARHPVPAKDIGMPSSDAKGAA